MSKEKAPDPRIRQLLEAPILPLLLKMAWPNMLIMLVQASTGLIETWWVSRLGTDALAATALVFPPFMLVTMISAGAVGGAISSLVARALGAGRQIEANSLILHAVLINLVLGILFSFVFLFFGREIYQFLGGQGAALEDAVVYSNTLFAGVVFIWLMNGLASVIRGTGNMLFPAVVTCAGALLLVPLSPLLIYGWGPIPAFGIVGAGLAQVLFFIGGTVTNAWYILSGRVSVRFQWGGLRREYFAGILRLGGIASLMSIQTNVVIAGVTAMVASVATVEAVAGFGTATRVEYLLIPVVFGLGMPLVALVGVNIGAGNRERALSIALTGGVVAFCVTESIGLAAAIWPEQWLALFSAEPEMIAAGATYLRTVGPAYGFFGLGLALYFASQGAGRLLWPFISAFLRLLVALGAGWLATTLTGSLHWLFGAVAAALVVYGMLTFLAVRAGVWFK